MDVVRGFGTSSLSRFDGNRDSVVMVVEPMVKKLACGDVGAGALAELEDIVACVQKCLSSNVSLGLTGTTNFLCDRLWIPDVLFI